LFFRTLFATQLGWGLGAAGMTSSGHDIKRSGLEPAFAFVRLFPAKITHVFIENFKDSATLLRVNSKSKLTTPPWVNRCEFTVTWLSHAID
jgi:hypothetical protein